LRRKFYTLDVFTEAALAGNALAVVLDCDGLDAARMQAIAREFNLSETVFLLPPRDPVNTARARIFTPGLELPFAGHPTVGTAVLLAELRAPEMLLRQDVAIVIEEGVGNVNCTVRHLKNSAARGSFLLPRLPEYLDRLGTTEAIAAALGLAPADIGFGRHQPARLSAGVAFAFVPAASREAVRRIRLDLGQWQAAFGKQELAPVFVYCSEPLDDSRHFHARMFAPGMGVSEDPATGSAAAALSGAIMRFDRPADGDHTFVIEQGFEIGRPSLITLGLEVSGGNLVSASIGGSAVIVAQGIIEA